MKKFMIMINGKVANSYNSKSVAIKTFWRKAQQLQAESNIILYAEGETLFELYTGEI